MTRQALWLTLLITAACGNETSLTPDVDDVVDEDEEEEVVVDPAPVLNATTRGMEHWVAYMENLDLNFNGPPAFSVVVHADADTAVTVDIPQTGLTFTNDVQSGWTQIELPNAVLYPTGSNVLGIHGIRVTSDRPIEVLALHDRAYFSEATLALPKAELGSRYRVVAAADFSGANRSSFIVSAIADDTAVTITPSTVTTAAFGADTPIELTLNAGETYQVHAFGDLSGSLVEADKDVAVFAGGADASVSCGATSHAWEQLPPLKRWGMDFEAVPLHGQGGDLLVIVSDTDGTEVRIKCGEPVLLNAGESLVEAFTRPTRVTSTEPVAVGQLAKGGTCTRSGLGDANLAILTPVVLDRQNAQMYSDLSTFPSGSVGRTGYAIIRGEPGETSPESGLLTEPVTAFDGVVRGVGFAVSQFDARTFSLGYDCIGCVPELKDPAVCP
ncbi:MAG: IgGFc-binding protein [Myxococcota bacterium]